MTPQCIFNGTCIYNALLLFCENTCISSNSKASFILHCNTAALQISHFVPQLNRMYCTSRKNWLNCVAIQLCSFWYRDGNSGTASHHNVDAVKYGQNFLCGSDASYCMKIYFQIYIHVYYLWSLISVNFVLIIVWSCQVWRWNSPVSGDSSCQTWFRCAGKISRFVLHVCDLWISQLSDCFGW